MPQGIAHHPVASCRIAENSPSTVGLLAGILARLGEVDRLDALVARLREMAPLGFFWYHLLRSEIEVAADYYAKMIEQRDSEATLLASARLLQPLRSSPRWPALAKLMNLPVEILSR